MMEWLARKALGEAVDAPSGTPEGVRLRRGRWIPRLGGFLARSGGPAAAVTFRRTIIVHPDVALTPRLLRHELTHVRQWLRDPLLFPVRYTLGFLRHGYRGNPYEVEARTAESGTGAGGTRAPTEPSGRFPGGSR